MKGGGGLPTSGLLEIAFQLSLLTYLGALKMYCFIAYFLYCLCVFLAFKCSYGLLEGIMIYWHVRRGRFLSFSSVSICK